jgi:dephospho-CoA kinase
MIRVKREKISKIDSPSENEMDFILDDEFDYVINNDLSIDSFYQKIDKCLKSLVIKK